LGVPLPLPVPCGVNPNILGGTPALARSVRRRSLSLSLCGFISDLVESGSIGPMFLSIAQFLVGIEKGRTRETVARGFDDVGIAEDNQLTLLSDLPTETGRNYLTTVLPRPRSPGVECEALRQ